MFEEISSKRSAWHVIDEKSRWSPSTARWEPDKNVFSNFEQRWSSPKKKLPIHWWNRHFSFFQFHVSCLLELMMINYGRRERPKDGRTPQHYRHESILMDGTPVFWATSSLYEEKQSRQSIGQLKFNSAPSLKLQPWAFELTLIGTLTSCGSKNLESIFIHQIGWAALA